MKITTISYGKTFNDGNFESTRIDITADVEPQELVSDAFSDLVDTLNEMRELQLNAPAPVDPIPTTRRRRP